MRASLRALFFASTCALAQASQAGRLDTVFAEGFENGWNGWFATNGVWEIGQQCTEPGWPGAAEGTGYAGTVLCAEYPGTTDSTLASPTITLPTLAPGEELRLRFTQWFEYGASDWGQVQLSERLPGGGWSDPVVVSYTMLFVSDWSVSGSILTAWAGKDVKIGFFHQADPFPFGEVGRGWYVDDVRVERYLPESLWDHPTEFEAGWAGWAAGSGVWQVGPPTSGPGAAHRGISCAATHLAADYPPDTDSLLGSPITVLPSVLPGEELWLTFWHWMEFGANDYGQLQITERLPGGAWLPWAAASQTMGPASGWSLRGRDLTPDAGKTVRIGFFHQADHAPFYESGPGWYLDDVSLRRGMPHPPLAREPESFEMGWRDWVATNGVWQVGSATSGPAACHEEASCAATILAGDYPPDTDSWLVSPTIELPASCPGQELWLRFWHWFEYDLNDGGQILLWERLSDGTWASATSVLDTLPSGSSGAWSVKAVDLTPHAGKGVRLIFAHGADHSPFYESGSGWYLDEVEIQGDWDGDRVADLCDRCPAAWNPGQLDLDADGAGDACDPDDDGDGVADLADNCEGASNPAQADADADGSGDACDCAPLDATHCRPAEIAALRFHLAGSKATFSWEGAPCADAYQVLRGLLSNLPWADLGSCRADAVLSSTFTDSDMPPAGDGFGILVRGVDQGCGGAGPWTLDRWGSEQQNANPRSCP